MQCIRLTVYKKAAILQNHTQRHQSLAEMQR